MKDELWLGPQAWLRHLGFRFAAAGTAGRLQPDVSSPKQITSAELTSVCRTGGGNVLPLQRNRGLRPKAYIKEETAIILPLESQ